jgi:uncharacterized protein (TIGR03083 family)
MACAEVLQAMEIEAECLVAAMLELSEEEFEQPTPCEPWSTRELLAHVLVACQRLPPMLGEPEPARAEVSALQYFRNDRLGGAPDPDRIEAARGHAAEFPTGHEIADALAIAVRDMASLARSEPPERIVRTRWGDAMLLSEYLKTRVFELAVHGLDLARAVGREPWLSEQAASLTEQVLTERTNSAELRGLGWDRLTFIDKATGRAPLTDAEAEEHRLREGLLWPRSS